MHLEQWAGNELGCLEGLRNKQRAAQNTCTYMHMCAIEESNSKSAIFQ